MAGDFDLRVQLALRLLIVVAAVTLVMVGCGGTEGDLSSAGSVGASSGAVPTTSVTDSPVSCVDGPADDETSELVLEIHPNPVGAGETAVLRTTDPVDGEATIVGAGLEWQCWDGEECVATHQLFRAPYYRGGAAAIAVEPGATTAAPAVGVPLPSSDSIVIPEVSPGTYRVVDRGLRPGGSEVTGSLRVEVQ